jgi:transposase-like protein
VADVDAKEVVGVYVSDTRYNLDVFSFLKKILRFYVNKPVVIGDKATW